MTLDGSVREIDMIEFDPPMNTFARVAAVAERRKVRVLVIGGHA
jgi:hypothetical protein